MKILFFLFTGWISIQNLDYNRLIIGKWKVEQDHSCFEFKKKSQVYIYEGNDTDFKITAWYKIVKDSLILRLNQEESVYLIRYLDYKKMTLEYNGEMINAVRY